MKLHPLVFYESVPRRHLHSFPTRRSSDLAVFDVDGRSSRGAGHDFDEIIAGANLWNVWNSKELQLFRIPRSEEHTSELQSRFDLVCRLLLEKKNDGHYIRRDLDRITCPHA